MPQAEDGESQTSVSELQKKRATQLASARRTALAVADSALERKALNVMIIDVTGKVDYADFIVVMSGRSDRQVASIAKNVEDDVELKTDSRCLSREGLPQATWVLLDFGDVVVHVFHEDMRGYYDLESLFVDAPRVPFDDPSA